MRFGTDGVRGRAHSELTEAMASDLGRAIARVFFGTPVVIGGDSRESTPAFITALSQGLISGGSEVESLGMVPTPVVAAESSRRNAVGVVISASHNPFFETASRCSVPAGSNSPPTQRHRLKLSGIGRMPPTRSPSLRGT